MPKETQDKLNEVYTSILGEGPEIQDESLDASSYTGSRKDGAYTDEDYSDDADDGIDPREDDESGSEEDDEEEDDYESDEDDDENSEDEDELQEIDERLVRAGRAANLGDDIIIELAETRPEVLEALSRAQGKTKKEKDSNDADEDEEAVSGEKGGFEPLKLEFDEDSEDEMGPMALKVIRTLEAKVNELGGKLQEHDKSLGDVRRRDEVEKVRQIDRYFDGLSKEIPELGKTGTLSEEQKKSRLFAFHTARSAMQVYGLSDEEALAMGAKALLGSKTKAQVKNEIISDLDRQKKRFISRGRSRSRPEARKTTDERAMEALNKELDKILG